MAHSSLSRLRIILTRVAFSQRKSLTSFAGRMASLLLIIFITGSGLSSAFAQSFYDLVGTYSGSGNQREEGGTCNSVTQNTMLNPLLSINTQTGGDFSGRLAFDINDPNDGLQTAIVDLTGTVNESGDLSGTLSISVFESGRLSAGPDGGEFMGSADAAQSHSK